MKQSFVEQTKMNDTLMVTLEQTDEFFCVRVFCRKTLYPYFYEEFKNHLAAKIVYVALDVDCLFASKGSLINAPLDNENDVSHATFRMQDIFPAFLSVLRYTPEYAEWQKETPEDNPFIHNYNDADHPMWDDDSVAMYDFLHEINDTLDRYAPDGWYFGSREGNASSYGYWKMPEEEETESTRVLLYNVLFKGIEVNRSRNNFATAFGTIEEAKDFCQKHAKSKGLKATSEPVFLNGDEFTPGSMTTYKCVNDFGNSYIYVIYVQSICVKHYITEKL